MTTSHNAPRPRTETAREGAAVGAAEPSRCESGSVVCMATQVAANFISRPEWNARSLPDCAEAAKESRDSIDWPCELSSHTMEWHPQPFAPLKPHAPIRDRIHAACVDGAR